MSPNDITIMHVKTQLPNGRLGNSRLYYYQGNFYYPLERLSFDTRARVRQRIKQFKKDNAELIKIDRAHPSYKTLVQIFDEQFGEVVQ